MKKVINSPLRNEKFWVGAGGLEAGMIPEAEKQGMTLSMLLEQMKSEKLGERSTYLGLTKGEVLAKKRELRQAGQIAPKTAFEECLERAGIKASGKFADPVSKFFEYSDTSVLFPEFVADRVHAGLLDASLVSELAMAETVIDSRTFEKLYLEDDEDDRELREVSDLTDLPETRIEVGDQSIRLDMYGRYVKVSQLDLKYQRANVFAKFMERVGQQIGIDQTDLLIYRLINGDGNSNTTPATTKTAAATGAAEVSFADTITWATALPTPYKMDKFVTRKTNLVKWLTRLYDGQTTSVGNDFMKIYPQPLEWDRSVVTANYFWGVDSRYAIEYVSTGGVQTNSEDIIRQVAKGYAVYMLYNFAIADQNAVAKFDMSS
jgi:hypothetical protein